MTLELGAIFPLLVARPHSFVDEGLDFQAQAWPHASSHHIVMSDMLAKEANQTARRTYQHEINQPGGNTP